MITVAPSILSADLSILAQELDSVSLAQWIHVDIMDGHFVPNISFGMPIVQAVKKSTDRFIDVHLMIQNPINYIDEFSQSGADMISFHPESSSDPQQVISKIKQNGKKVGLVLNPDIEVEVITPYLDQVDMVLIMTVKAGFGGQQFMEQPLSKIKQIKQVNPKLIIEVDGGINLENAPLVVGAGADVLVTGSALFGSADRNDTIKQLISLG